MADRTPAVASGARTTVAGIASTRLVVDMHDAIFNYENQGAPLYVTLNMLGAEDAINKTVSWHTDELVPKFARVNNGGGYSDSDVTFTVDTPGGSYLNSGWLIQVTRTGETMLTTTGGSATSIVAAARSWGNVAAAALVDNDEILILGPASAEAASLGSAISTTEVQYSNNLQTFRHNWNVGALLMELSKRGGTYNGEEAKRQREKTFATHKRALELGLLFSEAATSAGTATMYGLIPWSVRYAAGNVNTASTVTESVFEAANEIWFRGGESEERVLMMSRLTHGIANQFAASLQRTKSGQKQYGLRITDYQSAHGDVSFVRNVHLEGDEYKKYAVGFDPKKVKLKYGRKTRVLKDRQGVSADAYEEEIITDLSAIWGAPDTTMVWTDWAA